MSIRNKVQEMISAKIDSNWFNDLLEEKIDSIDLDEIIVDAIREHVEFLDIEDQIIDIVNDEVRMQIEDVDIDDLINYHPW